MTKKEELLGLQKLACVSNFSQQKKDTINNALDDAIDRAVTLEQRLPQFPGCLGELLFQRAKDQELSVATYATGLERLDDEELGVFLMHVLDACVRNKCFPFLGNSDSDHLLASIYQQAGKRIAQEISLAALEDKAGYQANSDAVKILQRYTLVEQQVDMLRKQYPDLENSVKIIPILTINADTRDRLEEDLMLYQDGDGPARVVYITHLDFESTKPNFIQKKGAHYVTLYVNFEKGIIWEFDPFENMQACEDGMLKSFFDPKLFLVDFTYCGEQQAWHVVTSEEMLQLGFSGCRMYALRAATYIATYTKEVDAWLLQQTTHHHDATKCAHTCQHNEAGDRTIHSTVGQGLPQGLERWCQSATRLAAYLEKHDQAERYAKEIGQYLGKEIQKVSKADIKAWWSGLPGGRNSKGHMALPDYEELKWLVQAYFRHVLHKTHACPVAGMYHDIGG